MLLTNDKLINRLKEQLDSRFLIFGQELYLVERCCAIIRQAAHKHGYEERFVLHVDPKFDWGAFENHLTSRSLFAARKIIELRMPTGRPGVKGSAALISAMNNVHADTIVVVIAGALDRSIKNTKWYKTWVDGGVAVENPMLNRMGFRNWIESRLRANQIQFEKGVVESLAYYFEGNMLAAANEIKKISLGERDVVITIDEIDRIVQDQGRFNVFAYVDACLAADTNRSIRSLRGLKDEGVEPVLVLWALAREMRTVYRCANAAANGLSLREIFVKLRIWSAKQAMITSAVRRLGLSNCERILARIARADRFMKGRESSVISGDIWDELERISLQICGIKQITLKFS